MKNRLSGFLCAGLMLCGLAGSPCALQAQDPPPPQTPPPPATEQAPESQAGTRKLEIPELPKYTDVLLPGERGVSIGIGGWIPKSSMEIRKGHAAISDYPGQLTLGTKTKLSPSADVKIAAGRHNFVHLSYFSANSSGDVTAPQDITLWTANYNKGTLLNTSFRLQSYKASFEYLTWPYPAKTSKFRLRTLWGFQYTGVRSGFDAPQLKTTDADGNPLTDANGNLLTYATSSRKWFALPDIGAGAQYYFSRAVNMEINASGFAIPHHQNSWSADAVVNVRTGHYEIRFGAKAYHFRNSPQAEYWLRGTLYGPFIGVRWHSDDVKP